MEETVRAFNYVIEKGWVSLKSHLCISYAQGHCRHSTGLRQNGLPGTLRKLTVRFPRLLNDLTLIRHPDVADRLNLIPPIAEQCQHQ
jgi:hypothetical protein